MITNFHFLQYRPYNNCHFGLYFCYMTTVAERPILVWFGLYSCCVVYIVAVWRIKLLCGPLLWFCGLYSCVSYTVAVWHILSLCDLYCFCVNYTVVEWPILSLCDYRRCVAYTIMVWPILSLYGLCSS